MSPILSAVLLLSGCTGPSTIPSGTSGTLEPPQPPVSATGDVDLIQAVARVDDDQGTVLWISWEQSGAATVHLEFSSEPGVWRSSPERGLGAGPHSDLVLGVPYDTDVTWRIVAISAGGTTTTPEVITRTAEIPHDLPWPWVVTSDPSGWDPQVDYVLVSVSYDDAFYGGHMTSVLDRQGRVVWARPSRRGFATLHPRVAWGETSFLLDHSGFWGDGLGNGDRSVVEEVRIDGSVVTEHATPGLYHPYTDLPDGSIAYPRHWTQDLDGEPGPDGEKVIVLRPDGSELELFDCTGWLGDRCGANTLSYDPARDALLYSLFTVETVLELDATTGVPRRWFGHIDGSWPFSPLESAFWYQHGSVYTDTGTLLISTHRDEDSTELVVREYEVDEASQSLVQIWSFGEGQGEVGRQMGEAHRLPDGNTLHNLGTHAVLREITPEGRVVWDVRWENTEYGDPAGGHSIGRSAPIAVDLYAFVPELP
ncbi:MAG TPA: hypothetical protein ENK18_13780 [Deltaproteobacteria bacterium]|nr:hypothetical protein [Deltaproteobacteria bacterium]